MKATVIADDLGRTLWIDALRPGRMHDATAARNEGIGICFRTFLMSRSFWTMAVSDSVVITQGRRLLRRGRETGSARPRSMKPVGEPAIDTRRSASPSNTLGYASRLACSASTR
uniref:Transposase family protein n=1 Tax=Streptomyces sp. NBC_01393 TaxID=2903851 RepID=A0AAU3IBU2_9ACTN